MNELAKVEHSLSNSLEDYVLKGVSPETRKVALQATDFFKDRPTMEGLDFGLLAIKLAAHFHRENVSAEEMAAICVYLDDRSKFRPGIMEYMSALEEIRAENRAREIAGYEIFTDEHGNRVFCTPETAEVNNWTKIGS